MPQRSRYTPLKGGEDLVTPPSQVNPGTLRFSQNVEASLRGGYQPIYGYERFDGQLKPSELNRTEYPYDAGTNDPALGDRVVGSISGATATCWSFSVTGVDPSATAAFDMDDPDSLFVDNDILTNTTQSNTCCTIDLSSSSVLGPNTQGSLDAVTGFGAFSVMRRDNILAVPGSGTIRGVWQYSGSVYAFRDNAGATAVDLYKATSAGWALQTLGEKLAYTTGATAEFTRGETITGGTSGATGVVTAVNITSGTFGGGNAAGTVYFHTLSGTFQAETITGGTSGGTAAIAGASTSLTLPVGGRYEFENSNFYGQSDSLMMFGVNGAGDPFMWNGSGMAFMDNVGVTGTFATHIKAHKKHLFLAYGSSAIHSNLGDPFNYAALGGASEIAVGDNITGFGKPPGDALAIFSRNSTNILHGTGTANWNLINHSEVSGAREWTIQRVGQLRYLDDRGLTQLNAVEAFGDFAENTFSQKVEPHLNTLLGTELSSTIVREKNQYRIFFSDKTGLLVKINEGRGFPEITRVKLDHTVDVICNTENSSGQEEIYFGSSDGFVYQMEKGSSFDDSEFTSILRLAYNNLGSARVNKRFFGVILETDYEQRPPWDIISANLNPISILPSFSYNDPYDVHNDALSGVTAVGLGGHFGEGEKYSFLRYDQVIGENGADMKGSGTNVSLTMVITQGVPAIQGVTYRYSMRTTKRRDASIRSR